MTTTINMLSESTLIIDRFTMTTWQQGRLACQVRLLHALSSREVAFV